MGGAGWGDRRAPRTEPAVAQGVRAEPHLVPASTTSVPGLLGLSPSPSLHIRSPLGTHGTSSDLPITSHILTLSPPSATLPNKPLFVGCHAMLPTFFSSPPHPASLSENLRTASFALRMSKRLITPSVGERLAKRRESVGSTHREWVERVVKRSEAPGAGVGVGPEAGERP